MKYKKHYFFILLFSIFINNVFATTEEQPIEMMVLKAINTHPSLKANLQNLKSKGTQVDSVRAEFFPVVDLSGDTKRNKNLFPNNSASEMVRTAKISVSQELFSGFSSVSKVKQMQKNKDSAYFNYLAQVDKISLDVITAYLNYLEKKEIVDLSLVNLNTHITIYDQIKQKTDQGVARISDLIKVESRKARAQSTLVSAKDNLYKVATEYFKLTGVMPNVLIIPNINKLQLPKSVDEALQMALVNNPKIIASTTDIEAAEYSYKQELGQLSPKLTLNVAKDWENKDGGSSSDKHEIGLTLKFNIFNGGKNNAAIKNEAYVLEERKYTKISFLDEIKQQLTSSLHSLNALNEKISYLDQQEQSSKRVVVAYKEELNIGKQTIINVLDSENELYQANISLTSAIYAKMIESYKILFFSGNLLLELNLKNKL